MTEPGMEGHWAGKGLAGEDLVGLGRFSYWFANRTEGAKTGTNQF